MKKITFIGILFISLVVNAQNTEHAFDFPNLTRGIGGSFQKFDGLNSRIAGFPQYESLKDYTGTLQLGAIKEKKRFISTFDVMVGSSLSGDRSKKSSVIRYYGLNAGIGYDVIKSEKVLLYPLAGIGFQKYQARFFRDVSAVPFNNILSVPEGQNSLAPLDLKNLFFTYRLAIGVSVQVNKCKFIDLIGLQAGYTGSFKNSTWKSSHEQTLQNAPEDKISQFYVSLIFTSKPWMMMKK